jgi:hypothetical protein
MRRLSGALLAGALLFMLPAFSQSAFAQDAAAAQPAQETKKPAGPEVKYTGDAVVIAYNVNVGMDADYEKVLGMLKDALAKNPARAQQMAGWKVYKALTKQPVGTSLYVHVLNPVDKNADYSITNIVYENLDDQGKIDFFNLYKGALKGALILLQGPFVSGLGN